MTIHKLPDHIPTIKNGTEVVSMRDAILYAMELTQSQLEKNPDDQKARGALWTLQQSYVQSGEENDGALEDLELAMFG